MREQSSRGRSDRKPGGGSGSRNLLPRRAVLKSLGATAAVGTALRLSHIPNAVAGATDGTALAEMLRVAESAVRITGNPATAVLLNGSLPGPILRFREGEDVEVAVTNALSEDTSIHWHGLLVPPDMDGVPGISFPGIKPGATFTYRYRLRQNGTYWFHSHSGGQELQGLFGAMVVTPAAGERHRADRDYVIMLSDWTDEPPLEVFANLKKDSGYYNYHKRTVPDFFRELFGASDSAGRAAVVQDRLDWGYMRMDPTDLADASGYTFLVNGQTPAQNWTALFGAGEQVRLRFINAAGMTFFDVKIPDLSMKVIQADGQNVEPVPVDEFRIAPGETYDVLVEPRGGRAYTIFAQSLDRTGYARATLAERAGMEASVPALDPRPLRTQADMAGSMSDMPGMSGGTDSKGATAPSGAAPPTTDTSMPGMDMSPRETSRSKPADMTGIAGMGGMARMPGMETSTPPTDDHSNVPPAAAGWRKLRYADLRALNPDPDARPPDREIKLRLTGDMERYLWTINDKKLFEAEPVRLRRGERVRITYVNETMMEHPMHLHGMFTGLQTGQGAFAPRKHTVIVNPGETLSADFTATEVGTWALHCHLLLHMVAGMFVKVVIADETAAGSVR